MDRMRRKLQTKAGAAIYSKRKTAAEPESDRPNKRGASGNFRYGSGESARRVGPGLSDAHILKLTSARHGSS